MSQASYVISQLLVAEAEVPGKDGSEWDAIVDSYVMDLLKIRRMEMLSTPTRLAVAISIVGSQRLDLFTTAFRLLCDWEHVGGPFWLVQEEILRFAAIHIFRSEMNSRHADKSVTTSNIRKLLPNVLPNDLPSYIKHKIVKKRIHFLRTEFEWLLDDIRRCSNDDAEDVFLKYTERYPLKSFTEWFLNWAQSLLQKFGELSLQNTSCSRSSLENTCRVNMLKPNSMQNCTTPLSFARGQKEKTISNVNSISGAIGKKDKRQDVDPEDCDENDEAFEDQDDESPTQFRTSKRRKCSVRAHQSIPHSQSRIMDHAAKKLCIQFQPSRKGNERFTKTSSSMNEKGLVSHLSKKLPNDATYVQDSAQKTSHVNLNVAIPQSNHPNGTGISNISSKLRVKETTAVTMEKSDRNDDNDVADDVTLSIEPLGLDDLFVEEVDAYESNRDVRDILIRQQIKGSRFVDKTIAKHDSRNCGGVKSSNADPKSKIDQSSSNDLSDETPMIEPDFCANVRSVERDGVEYQNILSPLTPLSDSSILPTDSIHSIPQVEVPISPIAVDGSDTVTSDGGTQYYISESESEEETDRGGLLKTFAQSIWGIFSVASSDEA